MGKKKKSNSQEEIKKIADYLVTEFKRLGFIVQRYDAYSSNSVYLKLDYGLSYSIRISDHRGKEKLQYRYNVYTQYVDPTPQRVAKNGVLRYYMGPSHLNGLIVTACKQKQARVDSIGYFNYPSELARIKALNFGKKGFWSKALIV